MIMTDTQKVCGTCQSWDGSREILDAKGQMLDVQSTIAPCQNPDSSYYKNPCLASNPVCSLYKFCKADKG